MAYPDKIISSLKSKYPLNIDLEQRLKQVLIFDEVPNLIKNNYLAPETLFFFNGSAIVVLSIEKVKELLSVYDAIKQITAFQQFQLKLADMIVWLDQFDSPYAFILSPKNVTSLTKQPGELVALQTLLKNNPTQTKKWDEIRAALAAINEIPANKFRQRKKLADENIPKLLEIAIFVTSSPILKDEYDIISKKIAQYLQSDTSTLEHFAKEYFQSLFRHEQKQIIDMRFYEKPSGDQMGKKLTVTYCSRDSGQPQAMSFYIKTDPYGSTSKGSRVKPVDCKELLVYRILALTGIGCKVHFIIGELSHNMLYIATQDAGFTQVSGKEKYFKPYSEFKADFDLYDPDLISIETQIAFYRLDIVSRIFRLTDTVTNSDNFGRVTVADNREKWKLIDFRIHDTTTYLVPQIFDGFLQGNGMFNYTGVASKLLRERDIGQRIPLANKAIHELEHGLVRASGKERKLPLLAAIDQAHIDITEFINFHAEQLAIEKEKTFTDLKLYISAVKDNFNQLSTAIKNWHSTRVFIV